MNSCILNRFHGDVPIISFHKLCYWITHFDWFIFLGQEALLTLNLNQTSIFSSHFRYKYLTKPTLTHEYHINNPGRTK